MRDPAKRGLAKDGSVAKRSLTSTKLTIKMSPPPSRRKRKKRS